MRKLSRECEKMEKSRQDSLTRLYDVEKSRDQLKARLDTSSEALGKRKSAAGSYKMRTRTLSRTPKKCRKKFRD